MSVDKIVQFVSFDTVLDSEPFIAKWQEFTRSVNSDRDVTMQQTVREKGFRYIVQHRCDTGGLEFVFEKARRSPRISEIGITAKLAGGYTVLQAEKANDTHRENEVKLFAFLTDPSADLDKFRQFAANSRLNIYEAYYENCRYGYILEFFTHTKYSDGLLELLKTSEAAETGIYKECLLQLT